MTWRVCAPVDGAARDGAVVCVDRMEGVEVTTIDDHFAPSAETLEVTYRIASLAARTVKLQVYAGPDPGTKVFERDLTDAEKTDGEGKALSWDGACTLGDRRNRHATPLMAPFKLKLHCADDMRDERAFKILYHSIALAFGPATHTPDGETPPASERVKYAQARLNELGYDAGPVTGRSTDSYTRALVRFQRANYVAGTQEILDHGRTRARGLDAATLAALEAAEERPVWEAGRDPLTQDCKRYVHDNFLHDRHTDIADGPRIPPEADSQDRKRYAEDLMDRPFIPLEVEVKLLSKSGGGVSAPDAVGGVTIAFEATDGPEIASQIPSSNALARTYVESARAHAGNDTGDNCPSTLFGFRAASAADNIRSWFPDDAASRLEPHRVRGYGTEDRDGATHHRALVDAYDHATDNPRCQGRAGAYFRHSTKAGDDAKARVALTFEGRSNRDALVTAHAPYATALVKETGRWTIWRRTRVSAICYQVDPPARACIKRPTWAAAGDPFVPYTHGGAPDWSAIRTAFAQAFIEIENDGRPVNEIRYGEVVTAEAYREAILALPAAVKRAMGVGSAADITYRAGSIYGGPDIARNEGETLAVWAVRASTAMRAWVVNDDHKDALDAVLKLIHAEARKTSPEGWVVLFYRVHVPIDISAEVAGSPPLVNCPSGLSRADGAISISIDTGQDLDCLTAHELGHARFLTHHITRDVAAGSDNPDHHDAAQDRCTLSYLLGPERATLDGAAYTYPFCGKCLLRMRGWDAVSLPQRFGG